MNEGPRIYSLDMTPETVRGILETYERENPDLGALITDRLASYWIDRIPPGIALVRCPVCRAPLSGMKTGDFALVAVFSHRAEKLPGARLVLTYPICPACARAQAPDLAAEIYPETPGRL